jgi:lipoprotein-anchoring transpeptidase ErfK/SrfK
MKRFALTRITTLAVCFAMVVGTLPGYAVTPATDYSGNVPTRAMVAGRTIQGMTYADARAAVATGVVLPALATITVKGKGKTLTFSPVKTKAVLVDIDATLHKAYDSTAAVDATYTLEPVLVTQPKVISGWSASIAKKINRSRANAYRTVNKKKHRLDLHAERVGYSVDKSKTTAKLSAVVVSEIASAGLKPATVVPVVAESKPKVTRKNITKAILIVQSQFKIRLYKGAKIEKTYRCAVGMPQYPTPTGKFKVTGKVKNPVWHNPGSGWAAHMPATIKGGPNNPLGTRAIYTSAPGIRMHGVPASENWSIGHRASHGCLRMHRKDVENFYPRVPVGITVWIIK